MSDQSMFPLNFNSVKAEQEFRQVCNELPEDQEVYLIGGSVRNALVRHYHGEVLKQRDYDQIITQNSDGYIKFLRLLGFEKGNIDRETQVIYTKALVPNPVAESYDQYLVFDMHMVDGTTAMDNLKKHVGLTVNGFALSLRDVYSTDWQKNIVALPGAMADIENKQLRVNLEGYTDQAANFFACLRFMYAGFAPPPHDEVQLLLKELPKVESERFERNVAKVWQYTDGETNARKLVAQLGIDFDVFDETTVKNTLV